MVGHHRKISIGGALQEYLIKLRHDAGILEHQWICFQTKSKLRNEAGINNQPFPPKLLWYQIFIQSFIKPVFPLEQQTSVSLRFISFSDISAHKRHDFGVSSVCIESLQPNFKARFKGNFSGASGSPGWGVSKNSIPYIFWGKEFLGNQQIRFTGSSIFLGIQIYPRISEKFLPIPGSLEFLVILVISWDALEIH